MNATDAFFSPSTGPGEPNVADDALLAAQFRLSVEYDNISSDDELDAASPVMGGLPHAPPSLPLSLSLPALDAADASLWNLISPCSDGDDAPLFGDIPVDEEEEEEEDEREDEEEADRPEPEASPREAVAQAFKPDLIREEEEESVRYASSSDDEDEEIEVVPAATAFKPIQITVHLTPDGSTSCMRRRSDSLDSDKDELLDSVTEADELDDIDGLDGLSSSASFIDDSASEDGSVASSARTSGSGPGRWVGRFKSRTYSGPATSKMHQAYDKLCARTLSATATLRHGRRSASRDNGDDDGGFSSDDEDYDHDRPTRVATPTRATSVSFPTRLTSAKTIKTMQLPTKMTALLPRFRTSSSGTTSSEESCVSHSYTSSLDSTMSGGGGATGEAAGAAGDATPVTAVTVMAYSRQELKHKATACATRAAGLLGAASAEATRKLRTARSFRTPSQLSMAPVTSPVVDGHGCSPALPPLARRTPPRAASS